MAGSKAVIRAGISSASTTTSFALGLCWCAISARVRMRSLPVCFRRRAARWCRIVAAFVSGQSRSNTRTGPEAISTSHIENRQPREGKAALETIGLHERMSQLNRSLYGSTDLRTYVPESRRHKTSRSPSRNAKRQVLIAEDIRQRRSSRCKDW
jgi:hypothetical protein